MESFLNPMELSWARLLGRAFSQQVNEETISQTKDKCAPAFAEGRQALGRSIVEQLEVWRWAASRDAGGLDLGQVPLLLLNRQLGLNGIESRINDHIFLRAFGEMPGAAALLDFYHRNANIEDAPPLSIIQGGESPLSPESDTRLLLIEESENLVNVRWSDTRHAAHAPQDQVALHAAVDCFRLNEASFLLGLAEGALADTVSRAKCRQLFGQRQVDHQTVAHRLAAIAAKSQMLWLATLSSARRADIGKLLSEEASRLLALACEFAVQSIRTLIQLHGSHGLLEASTMSHRFRIVTKRRQRVPISSVWLHQSQRALSAARSYLLLDSTKKMV